MSHIPPHNPQWSSGHAETSRAHSLPQSSALGQGTWSGPGQYPQPPHQQQAAPAVYVPVASYPDQSNGSGLHYPAVHPGSHASTTHPQHSQHSQSYQPPPDAYQYQPRHPAHGVSHASYETPVYTQSSVPAHSSQTASYPSGNGWSQSTVPAPHHHSSQHASHGNHGPHASPPTYAPYPAQMARSENYNHAGQAAPDAREYPNYGQDWAAGTPQTHHRGDHPSRVDAPVSSTRAARGSLSPQSPTDPWSTSLSPQTYGAPANYRHPSTGMGMPAVVQQGRSAHPVQGPPAGGNVQPRSRDYTAVRDREDGYQTRAPPMTRHSSSHSSAASSTQTNAPTSSQTSQIKCRKHGCRRPAYVDRSTGEQKEWCGDGHQLEAVALRVVSPCVECQALPQRRTSPYCSIICESKALAVPNAYTGPVY